MNNDHLSNQSFQLGGMHGDNGYNTLRGSQLLIFFYGRSFVRRRYWKRANEECNSHLHAEAVSRQNPGSATEGHVLFRVATTLLQTFLLLLLVLMPAPLVYQPLWPDSSSAREGESDQNPIMAFQPCIVSKN